jgi:predicted sugar kinase
MDPISVSTASAMHQDLLRQAEQPLTPPVVAPPELVSKFQALMAHTPNEAGGSVSEMPAVKSVVAGVEAHLQHHAETIDRVMSLDAGNLSYAEMEAAQTKGMVELGLLSMNQAAYMQVMGSTKSTVSALMKNQ